MANNRLYLKCTQCDTRVWLASCLGGGYHRHDEDDESIGKAFVTFLDEHFFCNRGPHEWAFGAQNVRLEWEINADKTLETA